MYIILHDTDAGVHLVSLEETADHAGDTIGAYVEEYLLTIDESEEDINALLDDMDIPYDVLNTLSVGEAVSTDVCGERIIVAHYA